MLRDAGYGEALDLLDRFGATFGPVWDESTASNVFEYVDPRSGTRHQVWYESPQSLQVKYAAFVEAGVLGVGMWIGSDFHRGDPVKSKAAAAAMWAAVPELKAIDDQGKQIKIDDEALHGRRNESKPGAIPPVVVGANASAPEQAAAERLRHYLQLICGEHVELLASPVAGQQLAVGFDASVAAGLPASALEGLGDDGHIISSNRSAKLRSTASVAMAGADGAPRGTLYAVFGFLRTLGVEWYAVDEIPIPSALPTPFPPAVDRTVRPTMLMRDTDQWPVPQDLSQPPSVGVGEWSTALGFNGEHACSPNASKGGCITYAAPPTEVHTSYRFFDPDWTSTAGPPPQLWRDHPEWAWPRDNGTSCKRDAFFFSLF